MTSTPLTIRQLNQRLRDRYDNARNIRHNQGVRANETWLTTDTMPNTSQCGRIFVGYTDDLRSNPASHNLG